jgi:hypothetical protein
MDEKCHSLVFCLLDGQNGTLAERKTPLFEVSLISFANSEKRSTNYGVGSFTVLSFSDLPNSRMCGYYHSLAKDQGT